MSSHVVLAIAVFIASLACIFADEPDLEEMGETFVGHDFEDFDGLDEIDEIDEQHMRDKRSSLDDYYEEMDNPMISQRKSWMARQANRCIPLWSWCRFARDRCCTGLKCVKYKSDRQMYLSFFACLPDSTSTRPHFIYDDRD